MSETFQQISDVVCQKLAHIIQKSELKKQQDIAAGLNRIDGETELDDGDLQY
jgi:hypothetical protein